MKSERVSTGMTALSATTTKFCLCKGLLAAHFLLRLQALAGRVSSSVLLWPNMSLSAKKPKDDTEEAKQQHLCSNTA